MVEGGGGRGVQRCLERCMGKQRQVETSPMNHKWVTCSAEVREGRMWGVRVRASCNTGEDVRKSGEEGGRGDPWETTER